MLCVGSFASRSDPALFLHSQDSSSGELLFVGWLVVVWFCFVFQVQVVLYLKAITHHLDCLWASLLLSVFITSACWCSSSEPVWDVWQVSADTAILWDYSDLKQNNQPIYRDFSTRRYIFTLCHFSLIAWRKWPVLSWTLSQHQEFQGYKTIWFESFRSLQLHFHCGNKRTSEAQGEARKA